MKCKESFKKEFFKKGWILVDMGLKDEEINYFYEGLLSLKKQAKFKNYPLGR